MKYFINASDKNRANVIQQKVEEAIENYKIWQRSKMGRDLNPSELVRQMINAGAKRAEVDEPVFTAIPDSSVPYLTNTSIIYGGLEDD